MLLVASETGHVYTFATRKLQPMITSEAGKALIQTCLNSPDPEDPGSGDQRMSAAGFEETEFCYSAEDQLKVRPPPPTHPAGCGEYSGVMGQCSGYDDSQLQPAWPGLSGQLGLGQTPPPPPPSQGSQLGPGTVGFCLPSVCR